MPFKLILSFQRKVLPCSEKDDNFVAFAENKEHEVPFEIHMYRQLESALCYACKDMFSGMITRSRQQMPFFVLYFSPFFFFFVCFDYFLLHFSSLSFFFFLHSFLKYLDPLQVFLSMRSHVIWNMGRSGPIADITVHWTLGSFSAFSSLL